MFISKTEARKIFSDIRKSIPSDIKTDYDGKIINNIISSQIINDFEKVLCYVSVKDEPDTRNFIDYLLKIGKTVYVPYCKDKDMLFYRLKDSGELVDGAFGIPTVDVSDKMPLDDFESCICIVPALSFDLKGCRLGYGGGFYDRFLSGKEIFKLGITYEACLTTELPSENYDIAVDAVITEKNIIRRKL